MIDLRSILRWNAGRPDARSSRCVAHKSVFSFSSSVSILIYEFVFFTFLVGRLASVLVCDVTSTMMMMMTCH
jgi:hypothetical protein